MEVGTGIYVAHRGTDTHTYVQYVRLTCILLCICPTAITSMFNMNILAWEGIESPMCIVMHRVEVSELSEVVASE